MYTRNAPHDDLKRKRKKKKKQTTSNPVSAKDFWVYKGTGARGTELYPEMNTNRNSRGWATRKQYTLAAESEKTAWQ